MDEFVLISVQHQRHCSPYEDKLQNCAQLTLKNAMKIFMFSINKDPNITFRRCEQLYESIELKSWPSRYGVIFRNALLAYLATFN